MTAIQDALIRAKRNNIARYGRLLATNLTVVERQYIHKRIAEEQAAIEQMCRQVELADPETVIAAHSLGKGPNNQAPQA